MDSETSSEWQLEMDSETNSEWQLEMNVINDY